MFESNKRPSGVMQVCDDEMWCGIILICSMDLDNKRQLVIGSLLIDSNKRAGIIISILPIVVAKISSYGTTTIASPA